MRFETKKHPREITPPTHLTHEALKTRHSDGHNASRLSEPLFSSPDLANPSLWSRRVGCLEALRVKYRPGSFFSVVFPCQQPSRRVSLFLLRLRRSLRRQKQAHQDTNRSLAPDTMRRYDIWVRNCGLMIPTFGSSSISKHSSEDYMTISSLLMSMMISVLAFVVKMRTQRTW